MESFSNYFEVNLFSQFWTFFFIVSNDLHVQESFYLFIALNWINALFELRDSLMKKQIQIYDMKPFAFQLKSFNIWFIYTENSDFQRKKIQFNNLPETLIQIKYLNMKSILNSFTRTLNRNEFVFNITDERKKIFYHLYFHLVWIQTKKWFLFYSANTWYG